jgi:hypothetical protein
MSTRARRASRDCLLSATSTRCDASTWNVQRAKHASVLDASDKPAEHAAISAAMHATYDVQHATCNVLQADRTCAVAGRPLSWRGNEHGSVMHTLDAHCSRTHASGFRLFCRAVLHGLLLPLAFRRCAQRLRVVVIRREDVHAWVQRLHADGDGMRHRARCCWSSRRPAIQCAHALCE